MFLRAVVAVLAALATPAFSFAISRLPQATRDLDIKLTAISNTRIKAVITNTANRPLNLLKYNNFLDDGPIQKVSILKDGQPVQFDGMLRRIQMTDLHPSVFVPLTPGQSIEKEFDIASTADLAAGGTFTISSQGLIPFAEANATTLTGAMAFKTNQLDLEVDGALAASVAKAITALSPRTRVDSGCSGAEKNSLLAALKSSASLSQAAARAAQSNPTKLAEYFRNSDSRTVQAVVARFQAVARESSSTTGGSTRYYCKDSMGGCQQNVLAYTLPSQNLVVNCPIYYRLPPLSRSCHAQDQATTTLHEFTHNPGVYQPFCQDNAYGYENCRRLSAQQALNNADSYALFANGKPHLSLSLSSDS
ncbi:ammonium transporter [Ophidiomyces ophidiicola]|nr:ammonium transporter [Ophidiomyces ophidiicola]KAI1933455.1 ammonium transporter [Ophidiomyces ophidiicola]KAI1956440.1 ammonium transporter [Ophidiomyces ophidiicola]